MKNKLLIAFILLILFHFPTDLGAQNNSVNKELAMVSKFKDRYYYNGCNNFIKITAFEYSENEIEVRISEGQITPIGNWIYEIFVDTASSAHIIVMDKSDGKILTDERIWFRSFPTPTPYVAEKKGGNYTKQEILKYPFLYCCLEGFDISPPIQVISYEFTYMMDCGDIETIAIEGFNFSPFIIQIIQNAKAGDRFWFENIYYSIAKKNPQLAGSVSIRISE